MPAHPRTGRTNRREPGPPTAHAPRPRPRIATFVRATRDRWQRGRQQLRHPSISGRTRRRPVVLDHRRGPRDGRRVRRPYEAHGREHACVELDREIAPRRESARMIPALAFMRLSGAAGRWGRSGREGEAPPAKAASNAAVLSAVAAGRSSRSDGTQDMARHRADRPGSLVASLERHPAGAPGVARTSMLPAACISRQARHRPRPRSNGAGARAPMAGVSGSCPSRPSRMRSRSAARNLAAPRSRRPRWAGRSRGYRSRRSSMRRHALPASLGLRTLHGPDP